MYKRQVKIDKPASQPEVRQTATPKPQVTEEEVLTDEVPTSKPAPSNSLKTAWAKLLENVSSFPSRAILKQQALPVKISADEVVISIKNQSWLKQFGPEGSKHVFIVDAANAVFGAAVKRVIVRAPEAGDEAIRKEQGAAADDEKPAPATVQSPKSQPSVQPVQPPKVQPQAEPIMSVDCLLYTSPSPRD